MYLESHVIVDESDIDETDDENVYNDIKIHELPEYMLSEDFDEIYVSFKI